MPVDIAAIGVGFALLAPIYALLFKIQRDIGGLSADHEHVADRLDTLEREVKDHHDN